MTDSEIAELREKYPVRVYPGEGETPARFEPKANDTIHRLLDEIERMKKLSEPPEGDDPTAYAFGANAGQVGRKKNA